MFSNAYRFSKILHDVIGTSGGHTGQLQRLFFGDNGRFFLFLHGTGARRGPKHFIFHIIFARKSHLKQLELNNDLLGHAVVKICSF